MIMLSRKAIWRRINSQNVLEKENEKLNNDTTIPKIRKTIKSNLVKEPRKLIKKNVNFDSFKDIFIFEPYSSIN